MNKTPYEENLNWAMKFMEAYGTDPKLAEDPNRPALTPDDMKEGKPQTDEVDKGEGGTSEQGAPGKETAADVKKMTPEGTSVEGDRTNTGDSAEGIIKDPPTVSVSEEPKDDIDKMDNVDPAFKKAYASYIKLTNSVVGLIDQTFNEMADKNASEEAAQMKEIQETAAFMKAQHIDYLTKEFGMTPKQANDVLNQVADADPAAVMPPEAISEDEANQIIADAAAEDVGGMEGGEGGDDVDAEIQEFVSAMQAEGYSDDEIAEALEQAAEIADSEGAPEVGGDAAAEAAAVEAPAAVDPAEKAASDPTEAAPEAAPEVAPESGNGDMGAVQDELTQIVGQLEQEGYSQEEIAQAIMEQLNISPDEIVDTVMQDLQSKGFTEEEAGELLANLGELEQQGITPEQFAQVLEQQG